MFTWRLRGFLGQPDLRPIDSRKYYLAEPYRVQLVQDLEHLAILTVEKGYENDGASVPRLAWTLSGLRPDGLIRGPALVHDLLCEREGIVDVFCPELSSNQNGMYRVAISSKNTHHLFWEMMVAAGMKEWRADLAWFAVRWFGPRW